jgi:hypothetical protein
VTNAGAQATAGWGSIFLGIGDIAELIEEWETVSEA